jgi:hypothetical protein
MLIVTYENDHNHAQPLDPSVLTAANAEAWEPIGRSRTAGASANVVQDWATSSFLSKTRCTVVTTWARFTVSVSPCLFRRNSFRWGL